MKATRSANQKRSTGGFVVSLEFLIITTILILGLIPGVSLIRNATTHELADIAGAIEQLDQSYSYNGYGWQNGQEPCEHGEVHGAEYADNSDSAYALYCLDPNVGDEAGPPAEPSGAIIGEPFEGTFFPLPNFFNFSPFPVSGNVGDDPSPLGFGFGFFGGIDLQVTPTQAIIEANDFFGIARARFSSLNLATIPFSNPLVSVAAHYSGSLSPSEFFVTDTQTGFRIERVDGYYSFWYPGDQIVIDFNF